MLRDSARFLCNLSLFSALTALAENHDFAGSRSITQFPCPNLSENSVPTVTALLTVIFQSIERAPFAEGVRGQRDLDVRTRNAVRADEQFSHLAETNGTRLVDETIEVALQF
jgi:hypothetical protein